MFAVFHERRAPIARSSFVLVPRVAGEVDGRF
jgi:hypothetical protein